MLSGDDPIERTNYAAQQRHGSQPGDDAARRVCDVHVLYEPVLLLTIGHMGGTWVCARVYVCVCVYRPWHGL